jgi:hypothetical protein
VPSRRALLGGLAAAALLAGCASDDTAPGDAPEETDPTADRTSSPTEPRPTAPDDSTPTGIGRTTPREPVGTSRNPADVVLSNGDDRPHEISVTVRRQGTTDPHYDQSVTVSPGGRYRMDVFEEDASGTHLVRFRLADGTERTDEWNLDEQSEDGWLSAGVTDEGAFAVTYAVA